MKKIALTSLILCICINTYSQCVLDKKNYTLVLNETFDTYGGSVNNLLGPNSIWKATNDDGIYGGWGVEYFDPSQVDLIPDGSGGHRLRFRAEKLNMPIYSEERNKYLRYKSGMLTLKDWDHNTILMSDIFDSKDIGCERINSRGFKYGMFEIRLKMPEHNTSKVDAWPAFWLISIYSEIDIIDNQFANNSNNYVAIVNDWTIYPWSSFNTDWVITSFCDTCEDFKIDRDYSVGEVITTNWDVSYKCINNVIRLGCGASYTSKYRNLTNEFTTYTCVWTKEKITFFVEDKELFTIPNELLSLRDLCPLNIICDLQIADSANELFYTMEVDYIKVYKANDTILANNFKSEKEYVFDNLFHKENRESEDIPTPIHISSDAIAVNTNNPNEIFYRGNDNFLYKYWKTTSDKWKGFKIPFNDGANIPVNGSVVYNKEYDIVLYAGLDNRINLFGRSTIEPSGFYHWYLTSNWSCPWCISDDKVSNFPNSIEISNNGEVFYRGEDNKMHWYRYNGTNWVHTILPHPDGTNSRVSGNIMIDNLTNNVFYRGYDGRLQSFYKTSSTTYNHAWIDSDWSSSDALLINESEIAVWSPSLNGVLYKGLDNKLHLFKWSGTWEHSVIPYSYGSPSLGYINGDLLNNGLYWDENTKRLFYIGFDGRMQAFQYNSILSSWAHYWIDNNWNNGDFCSYNSIEIPTKRSSLIADNSFPERGFYYKNSQGELYKVNYTYCENILKDCKALEHDPQHNIFKEGKLIDNLIDEEIIIYPNPTENSIIIDCKNNCKIENITIIDVTGKLVYSQNNYNINSIIDLSNLNKGIYFIQFYLNNKLIFEKIIKM